MFSQFRARDRARFCPFNVFQLGRIDFTGSAVPTSADQHSATLPILSATLNVSDGDFDQREGRDFEIFIRINLD